MEAGYVGGAKREKDEVESAVRLALNLPLSLSLSLSVDPGTANFPHFLSHTDHDISPAATSMQPTEKLVDFSRIVIAVVS